MNLLPKIIASVVPVLPNVFEVIVNLEDLSNTLRGGMARSLAYDGPGHIHDCGRLVFAE